MTPGPMAPRPARPDGPRAQPSRSSRPGRSSSHVSRFLSRFGWPGGSTVSGCMASTTGPRIAARASLIVWASANSSRDPGSGNGASGGESGEGAGRGGRQDPRAHPLAEVELLGAGHGERHDRGVGAHGDDRPAHAERPEPPRRPADRAFGHLDEDRPVGDDRARRRHVLLDADPAAPDREQPADVVDQPLTPARGEGRRGAAEEPGARLGRQGVHDHERVHPAAMGGSRPAGSRRVGRSSRPAVSDPEPEDHEDHEPRDQAQRRDRATMPSPRAGVRAS